MKEAENIIGNHVNLNELCQKLVHHCSETSVDTPIFQICLFLMLMEVYWTKTLVSKACPLLVAFHFPRKCGDQCYGTCAWDNDLGENKLEGFLGVFSFTASLHSFGKFGLPPFRSFNAQLRKYLSGLSLMA